MRSGSTFLQSFSSLSPACLETNTLYFTGQPRIGQLNALESAFQFAQAFFSSSSISRLIATTPVCTFSMLSSACVCFAASVQLMQLFRHIRGRRYFMSLRCFCGRRHHANLDDDALRSSRAARASSQEGSLLVSSLWGRPSGYFALRGEEARLYFQHRGATP